MNFKVSMSETWFPELERVLNSEKVEYFFPENTGASGTPWWSWVNTARLGWRILYHTGFVGCQACQRSQEDPEVSALRYADLYRFLFLLPFPARIWDTMDTETIE